MTTFPTTIDTLTNPLASDKVSIVSHSSQHGNLNDAVEALETKLYDGASPTFAGTIITGTGYAKKVYADITIRNTVPADVEFGTITFSNTTDHMECMIKISYVGENSSEQTDDAWSMGEFIQTLSRLTTGNWVSRQFDTVKTKGWTITSCVGTLANPTIKLKFTGPTGSGEKATVIVEVIAITNVDAALGTITLS